MKSQKKNTENSELGETTSNNTSNVNWISDEKLKEIDNRNKQQFEKIDVENSPFCIIKDNTETEEKYWIVLGNKRVNDNALTCITDAVRECREINWDKIIAVTLFINENLKENGK